MRDLKEIVVVFHNLIMPFQAFHRGRYVEATDEYDESFGRGTHFHMITFESVVDPALRMQEFIGLVQDWPDVAIAYAAPIMSNYFRGVIWFHCPVILAAVRQLMPDFQIFGVVGTTGNLYRRTTAQDLMVLVERSFFNWNFDIFPYRFLEANLWLIIRQMQRMFGTAYIVDNQGAVVSDDEPDDEEPEIDQIDVL